MTETRSTRPQHVKRSMAPKAYRRPARRPRRRRTAVAGRRAGRRGRTATERRNPRPLRANQAGRYPHRRTAAHEHAPIDRAGPQGKPDRLHGHQEAGPDLQDPQGAREAQRADVRRRDAGSPARRLRLPAQPRLPLPVVPGRHLRLAQPDSPLRPAHGGHGVGPDPAAQGKRALLRPAARRGDQLPGSRTCCRKRSSSTTSRRCTPTSAWCWKHAADEVNMRRGRPDRADRLRPARVDRQPAAGRQDHPAAKDGQGRAHQPSGSVRDHAADRRAAGRSHRHGAAGQGPQLRSHQLDVRRALGPPHPGGRNGHRKGQADGRIRPRRDHLPGFDHAAGPGLERRSAALGQDSLRRRRRQRPAAARSASSAPRARWRKAAR